MPHNEDDKIEIEVEAGGREVEIEVDPETGQMEITQEDDSDEDAPEETDDAEETGRGKKRGRRFLTGVVLGALTGAVMAALSKRPPEQGAGEPSEGPEGRQDALGDASGGLLGVIRMRWREASREARGAAQEAERRKRARFLELTEQDERTS